MTKPKKTTFKKYCVDCESVEFFTLEPGESEDDMDIFCDQCAESMRKREELYNERRV
jgi:hypothetical protein